MKYVDEFRNKNLVQALARSIRAITPARHLRFMEVCGTHTQNFFRFGLRSLLPESIELVAGPGCPVCVSPQKYIDVAIRIAGAADTMIVTFGDMMRVPGANSTLELVRSRGALVKVAYSPSDAVAAAKSHPGKRVIFLAVGFETTAPTIALALIQAKKEKLKNLFFFTSLKRIVPAMLHLANDRKSFIDGFLCPGHVSAIIGADDYKVIVAKYGIGCCVAGFEPVDMLQGLYALVKQAVLEKPKIDNQYSRIVRPAGNRKAREIINRVFTVTAAQWRGLGSIPDSGLKLKKEFIQFDAGTALGLDKARCAPPAASSLQCKCAQVLKGILRPPQCPIFGRKCSPENPIGPCMVSTEGACNAYYRYQGK